MTKEIFLHKNYFDTTIRSVKTGNWTETGPWTNRKFLRMNWYITNNSITLDFFQYNHQKYKNRKPDRKPDTGPRANEPVYQKKFAYIKIVLIQPPEVQKPETGQKTGSRTNQNFLWMKQY